MKTFHAYLDAMADELAASLDAGGSRQAKAALTLRHAVEFATWRSLKAQGVRDEAMADLVVGWVRGSVDFSPSS